MNDAVFTEDSQQVVTGRFMYGPLDMVTLAGEKVSSYLPQPHTHATPISACAHLAESLTLPCRLTCTSWPSLRPVNGCTSTRRWLTAAAASPLSSPKINVWASGSTQSKWWSGEISAVFSRFECNPFEMLLPYSVNINISWSDCSPGVTTHSQTATWLSFREAQSSWCSASTDLLLPACRSWAATPKCEQELWMSSGTRIYFPVSWRQDDRMTTFTRLFVFVPLFSPFQALAGFRLSDHLRDRTTGHAEAAGGGLVVTAQFPSRHRLVLRRSGSRPPETQGELPQVPNGGQIMRER